MKIFDKNLIYDLAEEIDEERYNSAYEFIDNSIADTINIVAKTAPITGKEYEFFCVNELSTGSAIAESDIDMILAVSAPQIELNTNKLQKNKFKKYLDRLKYAWENRKATKKRKKKKRKESKIETPKFQAKYNAVNLKNDIMNQLKYYFSSETYLYNNSKCINIMSKNEIGSNINIYICLKGSDNEFKLYDSNLNKFISINLRKRYDNLFYKNDITNGKTIEMIRLFNSLFYNVKNYHCNQILMESVLYNIPNEIYFEETDSYSLFIKILNFLLATADNLQNFVSICDEEKIINDEYLCKNEIITFEKFLIKLKTCLK